MATGSSINCDFFQSNELSYGQIMAKNQVLLSLMSLPFIQFLMKQNRCVNLDRLYTKATEVKHCFYL